MSFDRDLQQLRRRVASAELDAEARLALGVALARGGDATRIEALEALYLARALGAEPRLVRETLRSLGAPPSPWTHPTGDAARSRRAAIRGPRRGAIVLERRISRPHEGVVDEDGTYLIGRGGRLARFRRFGLSPLKERPVGGEPRPELIPVVLAGDRVLLARPWSEATLHLVEPDAAPRDLATFPGETIDSLVAHDDGRVVVITSVRGAGSRARLYDASLGLLRTFDVDPGRESVRSAAALSSDTVAVKLRGRTSEEQVALFDLEGNRLATVTNPPWGSLGLAFTPAGELVTLRLEPGGATGTYVVTVDVRDRTGALLRTHSVESRTLAAMAIAADGAIYLSAGGRITRLERDAVAWSVGFTGTGAVVVDAEGVVYAAVDRGPEPRHARLVALAPDGRTLFQIPGALVPVAISVRGRLLATRDPSSEVGELVAIE